MKTFRNLPMQEIFFYHFPTLVKVEIARYFNPMIAQIKPFIAAVNLTERCCLKCIMCNVWRKMPKVTSELSTEEWEGIFKQLKEEGFIALGLTGGEVLLREDLPHLVSYAATKLRLRVGMVTNGYLLNEAKAKELIDAGIQNISLSIDAIGEKYEQIRGVKGAFERAEKAANILSKIKKQKNINVSIGIMLMKPNLDDVLQVVEFAEKLSIPVSFNPLDYTQYFFKVEQNRKFFWIGEEDQPRLNKLIDKLIMIKKEKPWLIRPGYIELNYFKKYFKDPLRKDIPCAAAVICTYIGSQGKVYGGCWSQGTIGDLRQQTLHQILHSKRYIEISQKRFKKDCPGCICGYEKNLYYSIRELSKEILLHFGIVGF
ncbi:MAG: hypothetical protein B5M53_09555 [Candidatus Cloacimonas sp. 4484_209]|nr:MAG: hypothetical protein B5M53_09555 [Candidatus Cloacimonas sp. 4484_209]